MSNNLVTEKKLNKTNNKITIFGFFVICFIIFVLLFLYSVSAPILKDEKTITIPEGYSITQTSTLLKDQGIIQSDLVFKLLMKYKNIFPKSGTYNFSEAQDVFNVIRRVSNSIYGDIYIKLIIPEGFTNKQLITKIKKSNLNIDEAELVKLTKGKEGYLFPDTYLFLPDANESDIVQKLEKTFSKKIKQAQKDQTITKTKQEIVIMASILEKESANDLKQRQIISGILWKRIREGIPLQVDAPFLYERGKGSSQLSNQDLKKDSPYNTYTNKGLTPTPIGNPGYDSLYAAAHPIDSEYYFYLHSLDGNIYYGRDHDEHLKNKRIYLK